VGTMAALEARSFAILALGIVIVHLLSWSLVLTYMNDSSLFGKRQFQFNRYYSTKTVHVHKAKDLRITSAPSHWESLGLIIPATDESYQVQKYAIDKYDLANTVTACGTEQTSACWLENNHGDYVFLNGESMSILSQISPSIYFGTLLTIYLLSSIVIVSNTFAYYLSTCTTYAIEDIEKVLRYVLIWINLLVYFLSILFAYGTTPFVNETNILGVKVEYSISSHLASIIPCTVTLILYLLHLRGRNIQWFQDRQPDTEKLTDESQGENENSASQSEATVTYATETEPVYTSVPQYQIPQQSMNGVYFVTSTLKTSGPSFIGFSRIFKDSSTAIAQEHPEGHKHYGPISSEASVIGAITVFLGGIGSLGLARGVLQEVEVQLVFGCTLGFVLLEICSHRMRAYWSFMFSTIQTPEQKFDDYAAQEKYYYWGVTFIRFVVLWIQLWLLILYYNTILHVKLVHSGPQYAVYALIFLYWTVSFLTWLEVIQMRTRPVSYRLMLEISFCIVAFFVVFITITAVLRYDFDNKDSLQTDDLLVKYENIQYDLKNVNENTKCEQSGKLKSNSLVHQDIKKNEGSWKIKDNWVGQNEVDAVELKVYYWTKGWNLQLVKKPSFVAWFCTNGLEHHWGQCMFSTDYFCGPSPQAIESNRCDPAIVDLVKASGTIARF
jgi:hypothetical protein